MPITYSVNPTAGLIEVTWVGDVTIDEFTRQFSVFAEAVVDISIFHDYASAVAWLRED